MRKKVFVTISLISFMLLSACNTNAKYVPWAGESANQIERLNEAGIDYKTQKGEIWIKEKDVKKAVQCCS